MTSHMVTKRRNYSISTHFIIWKFKVVHRSSALCLFFRIILEFPVNLCKIGSIVFYNFPKAETNAYVSLKFKRTVRYTVINKV